MATWMTSTGAMPDARVRGPRAGDTWGPNPSVRPIPAISVPTRGGVTVRTGSYRHVGQGGTTMIAGRAATLFLMAALAGCTSGDVHLAADDGALQGVRHVADLVTSLRDSSGNYPTLAELARAGLVNGDGVVVGKLGDENDPAPCYEVVVGTEEASWDADENPSFVEGSACPERPSATGG